MFIVRRSEEGSGSSAALRGLFGPWPDLGLASLVFLLAAAWISLEEVKQMSPTLWNFSPFLTRLLVQICLSGPRVRLSLLRLGTRE